MSRENEDGHLCGRIVLAAADEDADQVAHLFKLARLSHRDDGTFMFVMIACFAAGMAEAAYGDEWRSTIGAALNALEVR